MKQRITLGVVCLARKTFDWKAAEQIWAKLRSDLGTLENVELVAPEQLVIEPDEAERAAAFLAEKRVDAVAIISGTFHLGHLALIIAKAVKKPFLLWGLPELPYDGGKIRLNSVCGVNLNASNLYKAGIRNYRVVVRQDIDADWVDAVRVRVALSTARVGIAGYRAHGFFNLSTADLPLYRETGVLLDHFELEDIFGRKVEDSAVAVRKEQLASVFDVSGISAEQLERVAQLSAKLEGFLDEKRLDALAIRCWPEFAATFGISPCAAMSLLQSERRILACEGDVEGALSMLAHRAVGAETPFLFDFSQVDLEQNHALFWHCGVAPCNLWDGKCVRSLDTYFAGGKGVTADFVLKSGELSILRLDSCDGRFRLFLDRARAVPMDKLLKGTYLKAVFDRPVAEVLDTVVRNGIAHHASVVYGDFVKPFEILAKIEGWDIVS